MEYKKNKVSGLKLAYIGGGSRGWAWKLMNDLKKATDISGTVYLYDIDYPAAKNNEQIGNTIDGKLWNYVAVETIGEALMGADFVIISILPGTFDQMAVDVHAPEKYGIWQPVGDTAGPGGFIRGLRTVPMLRYIADRIRAFCPEATVINYTNPMAVCIGALYREFPQIRAYGCCHEVFGTQKLLANALADMTGIRTHRREIKVNVVGVNHFTWFTDAHYRDMDLFPMYREFTEKYLHTGFNPNSLGEWMDNVFRNDARVRMDLFRRFGFIAAAGDRHLAEFMDQQDYLSSPSHANSWAFAMTTVDWRKQDLEKRLARSQRLLTGQEVYVLQDTGEEGVDQLRALCGLGDMITNVNIPNQGQIPNLPLGTVVETNATFRCDGFRPVLAGPIPESIYPLVSRAAAENEAVLDAAFSQELECAWEGFRKLNMLKGLPDAQKRALFEEMTAGTAEYLQDYT